MFKFQSMDKILSLKNPNFEILVEKCVFLSVKLTNFAKILEKFDF